MEANNSVPVTRHEKTSAAYNEKKCAAGVFYEEKNQAGMAYGRIYIRRFLLYWASGGRDDTNAQTDKKSGKK